jgi:diacylglycerol kinase (ATP)
MQVCTEDWRNATVAIIFNPVGGSAKNGTIVKLISALEAYGIKVVSLTTTPEPNSATELARQAQESGVQFIIAVGGDGTADGVAEGIIGTDTPMGIFPGGTANLFASHFYGQPTVPDFVKMVLHGAPQPIDLMQLDYINSEGLEKRRYLLVGIGFGDLTDAISNANPRIKRRIGQAAYYVGMAKAALRPRKQIYDIASGGRSFNEQGSSLFVLNVPPKQMPLIARGCNAADGLLDLVVVRSPSFYRLGKMAARYVLGSHEQSSDYFRLRRNEMVIQLDKPAIPNLDGDPGEATSWMKITALKAAVRIVLAA